MCSGFLLPQGKHHSGWASCFHGVKVTRMSSYKHTSTKCLCFVPSELRRSSFFALNTLDTPRPAVSTQTSLPLSLNHQPQPHVSTAHSSHGAIWRSTQGRRQSRQRRCCRFLGKAAPASTGDCGSEMHSLQAEETRACVFQHREPVPADRHVHRLYSGTRRYGKLLKKKPRPSSKI